MVLPSFLRNTRTRNRSEGRGKAKGGDDASTREVAEDAFRAGNEAKGIEDLAGASNLGEREVAYVEEDELREEASYGDEADLWVDAQTFF